MGKCAACIAVLLLVLLAPCAVALPFISSPENYAGPGEWQTTFPYQRNAFIGFDTDPAGWPRERGGQLDLQPGGPPGDYYHLEGTLDSDLYESDWLQIAGPYTWLPQDTYLGSGRTGILLLNNLGGASVLQVVLTWHLDNTTENLAVKDIWSELVWAQTGSNSTLNIAAGYPGGYHLNGAKVAYGPVQLPNNWLAAAGWAQIAPNPAWEEAILQINVAPGEAVMIDSWHTATECVPEPGTCALVGLGLLGLVVWRRRRNS